jgi:anthranilate phosphoribosyltransferase
MSDSPDLKPALAALIAGRDLTGAEMQEAVGGILDGHATEAQIGAFLAALTVKKPAPTELVAAVRAMRARSLRVNVDGPLLDTCGTGGDRLGTFNVSTAVSFVAAAAGVRVAKQGNRAASGKVGAADVLEALGVRIELGPEQARAALEEIGIVFLFAPAYHPALGRMAGPRRELGFPTLFNLLGPLCNPARADHQLLGVFDRQRMDMIADALMQLGSRRALVVNGHGGADELLPTGPAEIVEVTAADASGENGRWNKKRYTLDPETLDIDRCDQSELDGGDAANSARIVREALEGRSGPAADTVALNAGAALYAANAAPSIADGVAAARELMRTGAPAAKLDELVSFTRREVKS